MENFIKDYITSLKNPKIKNIIHLQKANERKEQNLFIIEGLREIQKAANSDYEFYSIFFCKDIINSKSVKLFIEKFNCNDIFEVSRDVYEKIAYRENTEGIVVLAKPKNHSFKNINVNENPLVLVLEGVEKPGNIGAILRTADAAGINSVIICNEKFDLYNPNVIRSSIGCLFTVPIVVCNNETAIKWLKSNEISIYCTYLGSSEPYFKVDFSKPSAIVMGTEATGITDIWLKAATQNIIIPMYGQADSMNVSTSTAVVVFEACRQRFLEKSLL